MSARERLKEHAAGWDVIKDGIGLFSLEFIATDEPFYEFKVVAVRCAPETVIDILNSSRRKPTNDIIYKNRLSQCIVPDDKFGGGYHNGIASIRDFRPWQPWWLRLFKNK